MMSAPGPMPYRAPPDRSLLDRKEGPAFYIPRRGQRASVVEQGNNNPLVRGVQNPSGLLPFKFRWRTRGARTGFRLEYRQSGTRQEGLDHTRLR